MRRALRRLRNLWRSRSLEREFDDEIAFHFSERIERNLAAGMTPAEAAIEARRHFGSVLRTREGMREARIAGWIPAFGRDLALGIRILRRQPGLAVLAILTLSLGIGANTAVFSLLDAVVLRPLPYPESDRLVGVVDTFQAGPPRTGPTIPELLDVRAGAVSFAGVSFLDTRDLQLGGGTEPVRIVGARSEASLLHVLGVTPALGRLFTDADGAPGAAPVVILTDALWRTAFGSDRAIVGRRVELNGQGAEVVGVLPASFHFDFLNDEPVGVYVPFPMIPVYTSRAAEFAAVRRVMAIGRVKDGVSIARAAADVETIGRRIASAHAALYRVGSDRRDAGFGMTAEPLQQTLLGSKRGMLPMVAIAAGLLLVIACVNMGQFLLARAIDRGPELAVRSAIGAGRGRLVRQLVAESLVLAATAAATGLLLAYALIALLRGLASVEDPFVASRVELTGTVAAFAVALALLVTGLCNIAPLMRLSRSSTRAALSTREIKPNTGGRHALIAGQVAVTVTLLGVAGLLLHSLQRLERGDRGYTADGVTTVRLRAPLRLQGAALGEMYRRYLERLRAVPGIDAIAMASTPVQLYPATTFAAEGGPSDAATLSTQRSGYAMVSPDYFQTLAIPLRAGRTFTDSDAAGQRPVAVVNEELARRLWPGQPALGRELRAGDGPRAMRMTVVGVVGNVRPAMQVEPMPQVYVSYLQQPEPNMMLLIRARGATPIAWPQVKAAVWSVTPDQPLFAVRTLPEVLRTATAEPRRSLAILLGTVAALAVLISAAGMFTLVTYVTARRRREIALRRAIGARVAHVVAVLSAATFRWTCAGLAVGVAGALVAGSMLRTALAGVAPDNAAVLAAVCAIYLAVAAAAICAPAIAALRSDPATILRSE